MMPEEYQSQLFEKQKYFSALLEKYSAIPLEIFPSPPLHYRMRAEFRFWHDEDGCFYAMFEKGVSGAAKKVIKLIDFPIAHKNITQLMPVLLTKIQQQPLLECRLYQIEFLTTLTGDTLVTLIYHCALDEEWAKAAKALADELQIQIIGRSRKQKWVLERDYVLEKLTVAGETFQYKQLEGSFTQPNALICEQMLNWAVTVAKTINEGDLLELYCGNGNFTLPLSRCFSKVLATEVSKTSVQAARWNITANKADNIAIARLSAEEFTQAYQGVRPFKRLMDENIDLKDYQFNTIFVDPPRAGIDSDTLQLLVQFKNIIYISCNPITLAENLKILTQTHEIKRIALFDQFPSTPHIESGVWLQKRSCA